MRHWTAHSAASLGDCLRGAGREDDTGGADSGDAQGSGDDGSGCDSSEGRRRAGAGGLRRDRLHRFASDLAAGRRRPFGPGGVARRRCRSRRPSIRRLSRSCAATSPSARMSSARWPAPGRWSISPMAAAARRWDEIKRTMVDSAVLVAECAVAAGISRLVHVGSIAGLYLGDPDQVITGGHAAGCRGGEAQSLCPG